MQIAIALYPGFTALDAIGPYNVFTNLPGADVVLVAERAGRLDDDNGLLHLDVEHTLADVPAPDVLLVPGGMVARRVAAESGPLVEWVRSAHEHTTWTTSVCTGALILGAAGVLEGRTAVTHWHAAVAAGGLRGHGHRAAGRRRRQGGHGGGRVGGHRPGAHAGGPDGRRRGGPGHPARHRVRPPTPVRRGCAVQGAGPHPRTGQGPHDPGRGPNWGSVSAQLGSRRAEDRYGAAARRTSGEHTDEARPPPEADHPTDPRRGAGGRPRAPPAATTTGPPSAPPCRT